MTAAYYDIPICLPLESPFLLSGLGASQYGIDAAPLRRDPNNRKSDLLMPAAQVRGILRHAVAINDDTGAGREGHLLTIELPAAVGEVADFQGILRLYANSNQQAAQDTELLNQALNYIVAIGKFKTAGYGRLRQPSIGQAKFFRSAVGNPSDLARNAAEEMRLDYSFTLDRALLIDTTYPEANFVRSGKQIPGSTLKGALARQLERGGYKPNVEPLKSILSRFVFGFARLPDNIEPTYDVRMRVSIAAETGAAKNGALFSQAMIRPEIKGRPIRWRCSIYWPGGSDSEDLPMLETVLGTLKEGLLTLGKTGAAMENTQLVKASSTSIPGSGSIWRLVLKTPTLMLRTSHLRSAEALVDAYRTYFRTVSNGALTIADDSVGEANFSATQHLRGRYLQARFKTYGPDVVEPFVITEIGSEFVLKPVKDVGDAKACLQRWSVVGLPAARWSNTDNSMDCETSERFNENPFLPENGFGEVAISAVEDTV